MSFMKAELFLPSLQWGGSYKSPFLGFWVQGDIRTSLDKQRTRHQEALLASCEQSHQLLMDIPGKIYRRCLRTHRSLKHDIFE